VVEILCPPSCHFLTSGQQYRWLKKYLSLLQNEEDSVRRQKFYETTRDFHEVLAELEKIITRYGAGLRSLTDRDALQAVKTLKATYETEQKGVIYTHTTSNPLAQALVHEAREAIESFKAELKERDESLRTGDLIDCLGVVEVDILYHLKTDSRADGYLRFIARNHPEEAVEKGQGRIVVSS
jgi:hypothetical protein